MICWALAEPLGAPTHVQIVLRSTTAHGRWNSVTGAAFYEVWTKLHGGWHFSSKEEQFSPLTSSFQDSHADERTWYKIRAVSAKGEKSEFSEAVRATVLDEELDSRRDDLSPLPSGTNPTQFNPDSPPPAPPESLFAVWSSAREVQLIWRTSPGAVSYAVEELVNDRWVSVIDLQFSKETTAVLKDRPMPGPYAFRVRAVGRNGRASAPSRVTTLKR